MAQIIIQFEIRVRVRMSTKTLSRQEVVEMVDQMPAFPESVQQVLELTGDINCSPRDLVRVVEHDPVLTGRILKVVNSAYFGLSRRISSVKEALAFIGLNTLKNVALTVAAIGALPKNNKAGMNMEQFLAHSLGVGAGCRWIGNRVGIEGRDIERAFLAGMLHNFGSVLIALQMPKIYRRAGVLAQATQRPTFLVERDLIGMDHFEIGGLVADKWKLESTISEAIRYHREVKSDVERTQLMDVLWMSSRILGELQPSEKHVEEPHQDLGSTLPITMEDLIADKSAIEVAVERVQIFREV
jgi:HD-like signal output (HDOD) protein